MIKNLFKTEQFEKDSLAVFEKLLQGYRKAKQSGIWESDMDNLIDKLSHLPTAPFHRNLMKLFDYNYLVLSEEINSIVEKSLSVREQMKHTQRVVTIKEEYYSLPFINKNKYLKRLEIINNEGELCYLSTGKLKLNTKKFLKGFINRKAIFNEAVTSKIESQQYKELEIYHYSQFIDCSSTNPKDYYEFFCDYYGKVQFVQYFTNNEKSSTKDCGCTGQHFISDIVKFTKSQQVLWAYFFFRLIGLKLRVNIEAVILTRFLCSINNMELSNYRNTYFHKLIQKAPFIKSDKNLRPELEFVKLHFQINNLPTDDIKNVIEALTDK